MFRVKCPICKGILTIDTRTRKVVSHLSKEMAEQSGDERFESIVGKIQKAKSEQDARLQAAKQREAERKKRLNDLFKKAQDNARDGGDEKRPGPVWD